MKKPRSIKVILCILMVVCSLTSFFRMASRGGVLWRFWNKNDIKVSVIVPVYNREEYISLCIDSLLKQTLKDIEIICVDDGSTDRSGQILDEYAKKDNRVVVIHQKNGGVSAARNRGLDYGPRGEYTTFLDSDDYIEKDTYRYVYNIAKAHSDDMIEFGVRYFCGKGKYCPIRDWSKNLPLGKRIVYNNLRQSNINRKNIREIFLCNFFMLMNKMYKTEILKTSNVRFIEKLSHEDNAYNLMIVPYIGKYEQIEEIFYNYRNTPNSLNKTWNPKEASNCIETISAVVNEWRKCDILRENEDYILNTMIGSYWHCLRHFAKNSVEYANKIAESFGEDIYNEKVLSRCSKTVKNYVKELEEYRKG